MLPISQKQETKRKEKKTKQHTYTSKTFNKIVKTDVVHSKTDDRTQHQTVLTDSSFQNRSLDIHTNRTHLY